MKKVLLIVGTLVVAGIAWFGFWIYDAVQNGLEQYTIAGEQVGLAGFSSEVVAGAPNTATATFTERLMPFTVQDFPFEDACPVVAADFDKTNILTIVVSSDTAQVSRTFDVVDGVCSARTL